MVLDKKQIETLIDEFDIVCTKSNGQNFLCSPETAKSIVELLAVNSEDNVAEIGPGLGSLTTWIKGAKSLSCFDVDSKFCDICNFLYKNDQIKFINKDAIKVDFSNFDKIISNIPYSISTELLEHVLCSAKKVKKAVFMCQSEFVKRISEKNGKNYGPLNILILLLGNLKKEFIVPNSSFVPMPKCKSTVFSITFTNNEEKEHISELYKMIKKLFINRRKTILNNLSNIVGKETATDVLSKVCIDFSKRPEELAPADFSNIFFSLKNR